MILLTIILLRWGELYLYGTAAANGFNRCYMSGYGVALEWFRQGKTDELGDILVAIEQNPT
jgi:hypothetical protein